MEGTVFCSQCPTIFQHKLRHSRWGDLYWIVLLDNEREGTMDFTSWGYVDVMLPFMDLLSMLFHICVLCYKFEVCFNSSSVKSN